MILCLWVGAKCNHKCLGYKCLCPLCKVIKGRFITKWWCLLNSKWCSSNNSFLPWWLPKWHQYHIKASSFIKTLVLFKHQSIKSPRHLWFSLKTWCLNSFLPFCRLKSLKFKAHLAKYRPNNPWLLNQILNNLILNQNWLKKKP